MASETAQQDAPPPLPGGKAVQFKVEQYLQLSELHIAPPAESALSGGFFTACHSVALFQPDFFHMLAFVHPPPFPLLLQKQSFLI